MENKRSKTKVFDDDIFGACINPQTGSTLNLDRKLATEDQIQQMILPEKLSNFDRVKRSIIDGQKIQKWSVLENFTQYATDQKTYQQMIDLISSETKELNKDLNIIMGYGLTTFFEKSLFLLSTQQQEKTASLILKMLSYEDPLITDEWVLTFGAFSKIYPLQIEQAQQFINRSFDFKASPERRRSALLLIEILYDLSQRLRKQTVKKIVLFSDDHNKTARRAICGIISKAIKAQPTEEMWKTMWTYASDKEDLVRKEAYKVLSTSYRRQNIRNILQLFNGSDCEWLMKNILKDLIKTFRKELEEESIYTNMLNIANKMLIAKNQETVTSIYSSLKQFIELYGEKFIDQLSENICQIDYSQKPIAVAFIRFLSQLEQSPKKLSFKPLFLQIMKQHNYEIGQPIQAILSCLGTEGDSEFDVMIKTCNRMLEQSHWRTIEQLLKSLPDWKLTRLRFDRITLFLMKLIVVSPSFLSEQVFLSFRHLILSSRKKLEFLATIKQKFSCAKVCYQRKLYVLMQAAIYKTCSWQVQRLMPSIVFTYLLNERISSVKMEYCRAIPILYEHIDPSEIQAKASLRQILKKYSQDKDPLVVEMAEQSDRLLSKLDSNTDRYELSFQRNKALAEKERAYAQVEEDIGEIKQVQTQKNLIPKGHLKTASVKKTSITIKETELKINKQNLPKSYSAMVKPPIANVRRSERK